MLSMLSVSLFFDLWDSADDSQLAITLQRAIRNAVKKILLDNNANFIFLSLIKYVSFYIISNPLGIVNIIYIIVN